MTLEEVAYGSKRRRKEYAPPVIAADVVGISVIIVSTVAMILGETTHLFSWMKATHPGVEFIVRYIAAPFYPIVRNWLPAAGGDWVTVVLWGIGMMMLSAFLYALIAFLVVRAITKAKKRAKFKEEQQERFRR